MGRELGSVEWTRPLANGWSGTWGATIQRTRVLDDANVSQVQVRCLGGDSRLLNRRTSAIAVSWRVFTIGAQNSPLSNLFFTPFRAAPQDHYNAPLLFSRGNSDWGFVASGRMVYSGAEGEAAALSVEKAVPLPPIQPTFQSLNFFR